MDELSKEYVVSFFDTKLLLHGDRPEAVGLSSKGQMLRHQSMLDVGDISNSKILDFGCGKGDFYKFLKDSGINLEYSGFDINEKLIGLAEKKYPGVDFRVFDIDRDILDEDFDYIFLCGVFNLRIEGIDGTIRNTLTKLFQHCGTALAFNALSSHEPKKDFELYYTDPEDISDFAVKNLSPNVSLIQDRIPYDFTMFVYRTASPGTRHSFLPQGMAD
jgi:SAM-dependent methyltransferase